MSFPKPLIPMIKYDKLHLILAPSNINDSFAFSLFSSFHSSFFLALSSWLQVEFIRRRQHISTIDTNSPSRLLLASNVSSNSSSFIPNSSIQIHKNHNAMGYCTLRNGAHHSQSQMNSPNSMSMIPGPPKQFQNPSNTCTLPRHHNNHWPSYGGTIAGVRNMSQTITISGNQPPPPSTIAMHNLGPNARARVCVGLSEEDIDVPLMMKRESTV